MSSMTPFVIPMKNIISQGAISTTSDAFEGFSLAGSGEMAMCRSGGILCYPANSKGDSLSVDLRVFRSSCLGIPFNFLDRRYACALLDSIVESLSGFVLIWRLKKHGRISEEEEERIEKRAYRFVGITFFVLGGYVLFESIRKIVLRDIAEPSIFGIIIAIISIIVMPVLGYRKLKLGKELGLKSLVADSKETFACSFLSVALLVGLTTRYFFEFWLADPLVGLIIVAFLFKEGFELFTGDED
jgi:hypothetical protein